MSQIDEEKTTAANYIITFYQNIQTLNQAHAEFIDLLLELETTQTEQGELTEQHLEATKNANRIIRIHAIKTYTQLQAIQTQLQQKPTQQLETAYQKLITNYTIPREHLQTYVTELNSYLLSKITKHLLETSQDLVNKIYK